MGVNGIPSDAGHRRQAQSIFRTLRDVHGVHEQTENLVHHFFASFRYSRLYETEKERNFGFNVSSMRALEGQKRDFI